MASISLLRAISRTSALATASVEASELTNTWMPSLPENAVRPMIGDDEPLRRQLAVVVAAVGPLARRGHHIDAGLQIAERLIDRETRW